MSRRGTRLWGSLGGVASIAVIGWLDVVTGPDLVMSLFYLVPVVGSAWLFDARTGLLAAFAAAGMSFWAEELIHSRGYLGVSLWNASSRLAIFVAMVAFVGRIRTDNERLTALNLRLARLLRSEEDRARTDVVTGLRNGRAFVESVAAELARRKRVGGHLSLAYVDLDNFKRVNDIHGHLVGDQVLGRVGRALAEHVRAGDLVARIGGDEFSIVFTDTAPEHIGTVARRLISSVEEIAREFPGTELGASVGAVVFVRLPDDAEQAVQAADAAMYEAKGAGKNRAVVRVVGGPDSV